MLSAKQEMKLLFAPLTGDRSARVWCEADRSGHRVACSGERTYARENLQQGITCCCCIRFVEHDLTKTCLGISWKYVSAKVARNVTHRSLLIPAVSSMG